MGEELCSYSAVGRCGRAIPDRTLKKTLYKHNMVTTALFGSLWVVDGIKRIELLLQCDPLLHAFGCSSWVNIMSGIMFDTPENALKAAREIWWQQVPVTGWLEAINAHPRLGDKAAIEAKRDTSVSEIQLKTASEQDAIFKEQGAVLDEVVKWNEDYEAKFGHVFLLFAHGKSMADILEHVKDRYNNTPMVELQCAVKQEAKIIQHRLKFLLESKGHAGGQATEVAAQRTGVLLKQLVPEAHGFSLQSAGAGERPPITCHVLDTATGTPAVGLGVLLARCEDGTRLCDGVWQELRKVHTNSDGRGAGLSDGLQLAPGVYRVSFDTQAYYEACGLHYAFYPQPAIDFTVTDETQSQHFHIPLLLSPYSYTTYRGS